MKEHSQWIALKEIHDHHLGKNIQNKFNHILRNMVKKEITSAWKVGMYYSIMLDGTQDINNQEQILLIIRVVSAEEATEARKVSVMIKEHWAGFLNVTDSMGTAMTEAPFEQLKEIRISLSGLRGQSYVNATDMKDKQTSAQERIRDLKKMFCSLF